MGDQIRFVDDSGDTRLAGELVDDGATVGDVLTVQADGTIAAAAGGGGSVVVRKFDVAYNAPGLTGGVELYTPTVGDVVLDCFVYIRTAWNGTTPFGDVGQDIGGGGVTGVFGAMMGPLDLTKADRTPRGPFGTLALNVSDARTNQAVSMGTTYNSSLYQVSVTDVNLVANATGSGESGIPAVFLTVDPVLAFVSQDGTTGGADPGASQGALTVYLVTATPQ